MGCALSPLAGECASWMSEEGAAPLGLVKCYLAKNQVCMESKLYSEPASCSYSLDYFSGFMIQIQNARRFYLIVQVQVVKLSIGPKLLSVMI